MQSAWKRIYRTLGVFGATLLTPAWGQVSPGPVTPNGATVDAPYVPLALYRGNWDAKISGEKDAAIMHISNRCERTGVFFVCEQRINGKSEDMIVFLPTETFGDVQHYKIETLGVDGEKPGDWTRLEISNERWIYSSEVGDGKSKEYWRTVNIFSGQDRIHFDVQHSPDGKSWTTTKSGDEIRVSP